MSYRVDASEISTFAVEVAIAPDRLQAQAGPVVERSAQNVARQAQLLIRQQSRGVYLPHYPDAITHEMLTASGDVVEAEVGPETDQMQGGMGPGVEFGSANTPPLPHLFPAFEDEQSSLERDLRLAESRVL